MTDARRQDRPEPTATDARRLAAEFLPRFRDAGWWKGPVTPPSKGADGVLVLGYSAPSAIALDFIEACYARGFCFSFDWPAWSDQATRLVEVPGAIEEAPLLDLRKLLTTLIRQDRFGGGVVEEMAERGVLTRVLERFAALEG